MIEQDLEQVIVDELGDRLENCEIVGSWIPADSGKVKGETDKSAKAIVQVFVQPRSHDSFSLPTVNVDGTVVVDARAEMCPTMREVGDIYGEILKAFDDWHYDAQAFSQAFSTGRFFATELRLAGGQQVRYDRSSQVWTVSLNFQIRGTVSHDFTND